MQVNRPYIECLSICIGIGKGNYKGTSDITPWEQTHPLFLGLITHIVGIKTLHFSWAFGVQDHRWYVPAVSPKFLSSDQTRLFRASPGPSPEKKRKKFLG